MLLLRYMVLLACLATSSGSAQASILSCEKRSGDVNGPLVSAPETAAQIFTAVAKAITNRSPVENQIRVDDDGKEWSVWEDPNLPGSKLRMAGGGLLQMRIGKCDGRITQAHPQK